MQAVRGRIPPEQLCPWSLYSEATKRTAAVSIGERTQGLFSTSAGSGSSNREGSQRWPVVHLSGTKTTKKMLGSCPQVPHSVLFLFALLPSLLSTGNFLYQYPDREYYPGLGLGSRNFHHHEDQNLMHMWHRRNSKLKPCQATPDIYFVLDK